MVLIIMYQLYCRKLRGLTRQNWGCGRETVRRNAYKVNNKMGAYRTIKSLARDTRAISPLL